MEKIKKKSTSGGFAQWKGKRGVYYEYRFTLDEKESLQTELKKFNPESVEIFIYRLQDQCQHTLRIMNIPGRTDHKEKLEHLLKIFKTTLPHINLLKKGEPLLSYTRSVANLPQMWDDIGAQDAIIAGLKLSDKIAEPLSELIKIIDQQLKKESRGKGRPESVSKGLIEVILKIYKQSFREKPTSYNVGIFANIIPIVLEAVGLPAEDPSRIVKQILKNNQFGD